VTIRRSAIVASLLVAISAVTPAFAQGVFLPATDANLRRDVALLVDEGVLNLPTNAWPLPAADVLEALERSDVDSLAEPALRAALKRLRTLVKSVDERSEWRLQEVRISAGKAPRLRQFGTTGRDNLELQSIGGATTDRWSATVSVTAVASPQDGRGLRLDGTNTSLRWGNWLFSANQIDRWWGPGWDSSLILSSNARPMPGVSLDRVRSTAFDFPVLRLLGPWRFTGFLAAMEENRPDVKQPLFMGMRASFKPVPILEIGLSRTAQFCGRDRPCNGKTFWNVLAGNDNAGLRVAPGDEPGNQMAGMDLRVVSPIRSLPMALYGQFIGEDNSSSGIPERYLGLLGVESWQLLESGSVLRWHVEYSNSNCKFSSPTQDFPDFQNCAYRQGIFNAGYRYHGRNIGNSADADSESVSIAVNMQQSNGQSWGLRAQRALLDRYNGIDPHNRLTQGPGENRAFEVSWQGRLLFQDLAVRAGLEQHDDGVRPRTAGLFGFIQWRRTL
jgi:capsule assembly protein Wzi